MRELVKKSAFRKMKWARSLGLILFVLLFVSFGLMGCGKNATDNETSVQQKISKDNETTVGDFDKTSWQLQVPVGAFDEEVDLTMKILTEAEAARFNGADATIIGTPVEIVTGNEGHTYLNQPVTITLKIPEENRVSKENVDVYFAAYYNGDTWDYIFPDVMRVGEGYIRFQTYHFSMFSAVKLSETERIKLYTQKMATQNWEATEQESGFNDKVMETFNEAFLKMGITDQSVKGKLLRSVAKEFDFGALMVATERGDVADYTVKCGEMAANALVKHLQMEASLMENVTGKGAAIATGLVKGALQIKDGNYTDAAKELSSAFIGYFPVGKAYQATIELIDASIGSWKDYELDEAYRNYVKNAGNTSKLSDDDWATMSTAQLRGYLIRLQHEAKERYCKVNGISRSELDQDRELSMKIASQTEANLRKTFEKRLGSETEIQAKQDEYKKIIEGFKRDLLLERNTFGFAFDMDIETRLRSLFAARTIILEMFDGEMPVLNAGESAEANLNEAIARWVSYGPKNRAEFYKWLEEKGYVKKPVVTEKVYGWVLVETRTNEAEWRVKLDELNKNENWQTVVSASQSSAVFQNTYVGPDQSTTVAKHLFPGNSASGETTWTAPASANYKPDEEVSINLTVKNIARDEENPLNNTWTILAQHFVINENGGQDGGASYLSDADGNTGFSSGPGNGWEAFDVTVTAKLGSAGSEGVRKAIRISSSNGSISAQTYYIFEWKQIQ